MRGSPSFKSALAPKSPRDAPDRGPGRTEGCEALDRNPAGRLPRARVRAAGLADPPPLTAHRKTQPGPIVPSRHVGAPRSSAYWVHDPKDDHTQPHEPPKHDAAYKSMFGNWGIGTAPARSLRHSASSISRRAETPGDFVVTSGLLRRAADRLWRVDFHDPPLSPIILWSSSPRPTRGWRGGSSNTGPCARRR